MKRTEDTSRGRRSGLNLLVALLLSALVAVPALAVPKTWFADGWEFVDGSRATGSFVYDAQSGEVSSVQILIGFEPSEPERVFTGLLPGSEGGQLQFVEDPTVGDFSFRSLLILSTVPSVDLPANRAGTHQPLSIEERICTNSDCSASDPFRSTFLGRLMSPDGEVSQARWFLDQVVFDDGGDASGRFRTLGSQSTYVGVDIATSEGAILRASSYRETAESSEDGFFAVAPRGKAVDATGSQRLFLQMEQPPMLQGGPIPLLLGDSTMERECLDADCSLFGLIRVPMSGRIVAPLLDIDSCHAGGAIAPGITQLSAEMFFDGDVRDSNYRVRLSHPRVGDLTISASYRGESLVLFDGTRSACTEGSSLDIVFDDGAPGAAEAQPCNPFGVLEGRFRPQETLARLDGFPARGPWDLLVENRGVDSGSVEAWCTGIEVPSGPDGRDLDADGVVDAVDNCIAVPNLDQQDSNGDGVGDFCDLDGDAVDDLLDGCLGTADAQSDLDGDGLDDACDVCRYDPEDDADGDGLCANVDNCPAFANPEQGVVRFEQTVRAIDADTFAWPNPVSFNLRSGNFIAPADIALNFGDSGQTSVQNSNELRDVARPPSGSGFWYLFSLQCPVGSYSTGSPSEVPGRDSDLSGCDVDGDGVPSILCGGNDCNDRNGAVFPGAPEICNGLDDNCNGPADEDICLP